MTESVRRQRIYHKRIRQYDIHPDADVHETAVIGEHPESRDLFAIRATRPDNIVYDSFSAWFPAVIGPTARLGPYTIVDGGIKHATVVNGWLLGGAHVGHDARVEEGAEISGGVEVGGHAYVGFGARVGMGALILPYKRVGEGAIVGAGAVVTKDVPAGEVWAGVPARFRRKADAARPARDVESDEQMWLDQYARNRPYLGSPYRDREEVWQHMRPWHHRDQDPA